MTSLSDTLKRLAAQSSVPTITGGTDRLSDFTDFGSDPGNLRARYYVPANLPANAPLVVVLHGCTQSAAGYDHGSGWSTLAERHGLALLYPEQRAANNPNRCFTWFAEGDIARDRGEAQSIREMIAHMVSARRIDPERVFVTGLSAGGAMTMAMLAAYPELFAGGAVIAGLPYGTALSVGDAMQRMRGSGLPAAYVLADLVRRAAPEPARWPALSVWHGTADVTVAPANMEAIVAQYAGVLGIALDGAQTDRVDGQTRRRWSDASGAVRIDAYSIAGLGHGTPIDPGGPDGCGAAMPFMLPTGINSTRLIAESWGITDTTREAVTAMSAPTSAPSSPSQKPVSQITATGVAKTIEDALRAAGLMR